MIRTGILLFLLLPGGLCAQAILCEPVKTSPPASPSPFSPPTFSESMLQVGNREKDRIFSDYGNLYNQNNAKNFGLALLGGGVLANTKLDGNFQGWYQEHVRSSSTDDLSKFFKTFGEGGIFIPIMATSAISYRILQERPGLPECPLGEFTDRTMRGYLVGTPALFTFQRVLGGDRPSGGDSNWRPFRRAHGVSGHSFMGAVPFITAAQMTDKPLAKGLFYTLSAFTGWSRVNDDAHYLSQALLGWYLAYLSVRAVSETEGGRALPRGLTIFPVTENNSVGATLIYQY
jgi:hypothetical protein